MTNPNDGKKDGADPVDQQDWNAILVSLHGQEISALMQMARVNHALYTSLGSNMDSMSYLVSLALHYAETIERTIEHLKGRSGATERAIIYATTLEKIAASVRKTHGVDGVDTPYRQ